MYEDLRRAGIDAVWGDDTDFDEDERLALKRGFETRAAFAAIGGWASVDADEAESELASFRREANADLDRRAIAFLAGSGTFQRRRRHDPCRPLIRIV